MKKIYNFTLIGNATYSNRGCEAIVRGTSYILNKAFEGAYTINSVYYEDGNNDYLEESDKHINHIAIKKKKISFIEKILNRFSKSSDLMLALPIIKNKKFIDALNSSDIVLMVGGDNYSFDYGSPASFFALNEHIAQKGKKYVIWGASIGPFTSDPVFEKMAIEKLGKTSLIFSRESSTSKYLQKFKLSNYKDIADPAFHLLPEPVSLPQDIETILTDGCIGINFSPLLSRYRSSLAEWIEDCADIISGIYNQIKIPVLLIPHVYPHSSGISGDDFLFLSEVLKRLTDKNQRGIYILNGKYSAGQLKWIISRLRVFAGARTHSTIASFSSCVPTICFGYSMKAIGIVNDIYGNEKWLVEKGNLNKTYLSSLFKKIIKEEKDIRYQLNCKIPEMKERSINAGKILREILETGAYGLNLLIDH